jgi:hypothetical protein
VLVDEFSILSLANKVEDEYLAFLNEVKKLQVLEYPTNACMNFLLKLKTEGENGLEKIQYIIREHKQALKTTSLSNNITLEVDKIKAIRVKLIQSLAPYIDWINGAQTQKVPWSFIPTAERLAKGIIPNIHPILYSENNYNYRIIWWESHAKQLQHYCFISLPSLHRTNVLMHNIIGHELFHPRCKEFTKGLEKGVATEIAEKCKQAHPKIDPNTLAGQHQLAQLNKIIMFVWERTLHELLCDMFCAELFGPASLLGLRAYASFSDPMHQPAPDNSFYPPWQYRFEVVWQKAIEKDCLSKLWDEISKHNDINSISESFQMEFENFVNERDLESTKGFDFVVNSSDSLLPIAYRKVNDVIGDAHDYVMLYIREMPSKWSDEKVLVQVPYLVKRLQNGIPPNEIPNFSYDEKKERGKYSPEAAELPAILIAGWMYQVYRERSYAQKGGKKHFVACF